MLASLNLGEEINNLDLSGKVVEGDDLVTNRAPSEVGITPMCLVSSCLTGFAAI